MNTPLQINLSLAGTCASPLYSLGKRQAKKMARKIQAIECGAGEMNRTPDLLITNELLYQLSYTGEGANYTFSRW